MVNGSAGSQRSMRIAHFGTFDVENYGDLLFPLVLERRLRERGHVVTHVSPVGGALVCPDGVSSVSTREALAGDFDAFVIGGGHLIHGQPSDVAIYRAAADRGLFAYADLWLGASLRASELGIPIVWNAPGIPGSFPPETGALARWAAEQAEYLALRDETSRGFLLRTGFEGEVAVVADTALDVARLWSHEALDAAWRDAFVSRGRAVPERALAVHFNTRFLKQGVEATAQRLDALARRWKLVPILLAIGPCHGDASLQSDVSTAMTEPHCLVDSLRSLREIAACIRGALLYVGSSLHGGVTARAFDRPAVLVAQEAVGGHAKYSGFLAVHRTVVDSESGRASVHVASWDAAWERAEEILAAAERGELPPPRG
ncbi:polysaccharide pyruvyl transferase family protein, partial [Myxococcota bacterium]|nr:polysaccharide pyruvyl transferase family protein [Myxococcota bacterium]